MRIGISTAITQPGGALSVAPWYLSGGISAANCIIAYQPKGATSLAASYSNLANPGVYDAGPGVAPGWDVTNGWKFVTASSQYLRTGYAQANRNTSALIRYAACSSPGGASLFAGKVSAGQFYGLQFSGATGVYYCNGDYLLASLSVPVAGNLGIAGDQGYLDGAASGGTIPAGGGAFAEVYIGRAQDTSTYGTFNILAFCIYNVVLTAPQMAAVYTAMAAL